jgi:hypothetical protein
MNEQVMERCVRAAYVEFVSGGEDVAQYFRGYYRGKNPPMEENVIELRIGVHERIVQALRTGVYGDFRDVQNCDQIMLN